MGVLIWRGMVTPKFQCPLAAKLCVRPQTFLRCKNVLEVFYHHTKFGVARISPTAGLAKKLLSFLSVRHAFFVRHALSVRHAFERQSLFAQFRHEGVGEQKWFWCHWKVCSCAPVLNFLRLPLTVDITKCWSPKKWQKLGFFAARWRQNKPIEIPCQSQNLPKTVVFGHWEPTEWTHSDKIWRVSVDVRSALAHQMLPSLVKGYRSPPKVKICQRLWFSATGSWHSEHIHMKFGM